jgi:hypothetical protein
MLEEAEDARVETPRAETRRLVSEEGVRLPTFVLWECHEPVMLARGQIDVPNVWHQRRA